MKLEDYRVCFELVEFLLELTKEEFSNSLVNYETLSYLEAY